MTRWLKQTVYSQNNPGVQLFCFLSLWLFSYPMNAEPNTVSVSGRIDLNSCLNVLNDLGSENFFRSKALYHQ
jgi:hypothetical protein